jgi:cobalt-precorrin 5A hydrolase
MSDTVVISLARFEAGARKVAGFLGADYKEYSSDAFTEAFDKYRAIVALMSAGIAVRKIAPLLVDKWQDPAVVVVSPDLRFAIPISGGHHGANDLAKKLAGMGMCPAITTATETMGREPVESIARQAGSEILNRGSTRYVNASLLDADVPVYLVSSPGIVLAGPGVAVLVKKGEYVVGIGCRKGVPAEDVMAAVSSALAEAGVKESEVLAYATTAKKAREQGLLEAVEKLSGVLAFVDDDTINAQDAKSPSKAAVLGLSGVAEPAALAISAKKVLVMEKKVYGTVTIAVAR